MGSFLPFEEKTGDHNKVALEKKGRFPTAAAEIRPMQHGQCQIGVLLAAELVRRLMARKENRPNAPKSVRPHC